MNSECSLLYFVIIFHFCRTKGKKLTIDYTVNIFKDNSKEVYVIFIHK